MSKRPNHTDQRVDEVLNRLNSNWDLKLPRSYETEAELSEPHLISNARLCSLRIRFLCDRASSDIDSVVAEFEDHAKTIFTKWVYKPGQEKGTLPSFSVTKSFVQRDVFVRKSHLISPELRGRLLKRLLSVLEDECKLTQDSDNYRRISSQEAFKTFSRSVSFTTATTGSITPASFSRKTPPPSNVSMSNKRRKTSDETQTSKRNKTLTQQNSSITKFLAQPDRDAWKTDCGPLKAQSRPNEEPSLDSCKSGNCLTEMQNITSSFETTDSRAQSVWSEPGNGRASVSNNTSFTSAEQDVSENYYPTQSESDTLYDGEELQGLMEEIELFRIRLGSNFHVTNPFRRSESLPVNLQFWMRWEVYRVAQAIGLRPMELYTEVRRRGGSIPQTYSHFWISIKTICKDSQKEIPVKSDVRPWMEDCESLGDSDGNTASFTVKLEYSTHIGPDIWILTLNPIKIDKGNVVHQAFGSDRHMIVSLNYFDQASLPERIRKQPIHGARSISENICKFLATKEHHIAGRKWRMFFCEQEKSQSKQRRALEGSRLRLHLFEVDSDDIRACTTSKRRLESLVRQGHIPIADLLQWHTPFRENKNSDDLKLFSRFGLALSKTIPTITLQPHQFRYLPDEIIVMNDGCALTSFSLAKAIWQIYGDGTEEMPSAFQGRIGGAKGVWIPDYLHSEDNSEFWIQVSDSQLKIKPHPKDRLDADDWQRTFQVLKHSTPCKPGHLNIQLINVLIDRSVPRATLRRIVLDDIKEYIDASKAAMEDPIELRSWLQRYYTISKAREPILPDSGPPDGKVEEACLLVESGFTAKNCSYLRECIKHLMTQKLDTYVEKLKIEVPHSTSVFCIPDLYEVLKADEVYMGFSSPWKNPKTGLMEMALDDIDILVARNPALLASDIQKRRAVYKHELRHFKDVIVFPTVGTEPLASLLSGGDYDGDTVTAIWEPTLVNDFVNATKPELPTEKDCGLQRQSRKVRDVVMTSPLSMDEVNSFLEGCLLFHAEPNRLGICTIEHEKLIYRGAGLSHPDSILLAALAGYLVDAPKQGLLQSQAEWSELIGRIRKKHKFSALAYKEANRPPTGRNRGECENIIDYLKFDVAMLRRDAVLTDLHYQLEKDTLNYDKELTKVYQAQRDRCNNRHDPESQYVKAVMNDLEVRLESLHEKWLKSIPKGGLQGAAFSTVRNKCLNWLEQITPIKSECDIYRQFVRDQETERERGGGWKGTSWSLLRASTLYKLHNKNFTWYLVADELARIKARAQGPTRELTRQMHHLMKPDQKLIKKLANGKVEIEPEEELDE